MAPDAAGLTKVIEQVWADALPGVPFRADATWDEVGIDSLKAFEVVLRLERALGARLPLELFTLQSTAADVVRMMVRDGPQPAASEGRPVFLVPGLFGDTPVLAKLRRGLQGQVAFDTLVLPGLNGSTALLADVGRLAAMVVDQIQARQPEGDLRIVGYSVGGLIACEAAARLERLGRRISALCVIDGPLPRLESGLPPEVVRRAPGLSSLVARVRTLLAAHLVGGRQAPAADLRSFDPGRLLVWLWLRLGLLEPARRSLMVASRRGGGPWTGVYHSRLIVGLSDKAALLWRAPSCAAPMLLIAGDRIRKRGQVENWRASYPQIEVVKIRGAHTELFEPSTLETYKLALIRMLATPRPDLTGSIGGGEI